MEKFVSTYTFKAELSKHLDLVVAGEEIVITKNGKPIARVIKEPTRTLKLGGLAKEFAGWENVDLDTIDWIEEFPQWKELYGRYDK